MGLRLLCLVHLALVARANTSTTTASTTSTRRTTTATSSGNSSNSSSSSILDCGADADNDPQTTINRVTICQRDGEGNLINCISKVIGCPDPDDATTTPPETTTTTTLVLERFTVCYSRSVVDGSLSNCTAATLTTLVDTSGDEDINDASMAVVECSARASNGALTDCSSASSIFRGTPEYQQPVDTVLCYARNPNDGSLADCSTTTTVKNADPQEETAVVLDQVEATVVCYGRNVTTSTNGGGAPSANLINCTNAFFTEVLTMESVTVCYVKDATDGSWTNCTAADYTVSTDGTQSGGVTCSSRLADGSLTDCTAPNRATVTNGGEDQQPLETIVCYGSGWTDCTTPENKDLSDTVTVEGYLVCYVREAGGTWTNCTKATFEEGSLSLDVVTVCYERSSDGALRNCTGEASVTVRSDRTDPGVVCASINTIDGTLADCTASTVFGEEASSAQPIDTIVCYSENPDGTLADCTSASSGSSGTANYGNSNPDSGVVQAETYMVCYARDATTGALTNCTKATYEGPPVTAVADSVAPVAAPADSVAAAADSVAPVAAPADQDNTDGCGCGGGGVSAPAMVPTAIVARTPVMVPTAIVARAPLMAPTAIVARAPAVAPSLNVAPAPSPSVAAVLPVQGGGGGSGVADSAGSAVGGKGSSKKSKKSPKDKSPKGPGADSMVEKEQVSGTIRTRRSGSATVTAVALFLCWTAWTMALDPII